MRLSKLVPLALSCLSLVPDLHATVLTPPTVTSSSPGYQGIYVGENAVGQDQGEFLTEDFSSVLEFDFGSAQTITGFINVTLQDPARSIGKNRLIFDTDGTAGFSTETDTVMTFTAAQTGTQGQGFIHRFAPISAQRVKWEVLEQVGFPTLTGTTEMAFLSVANGTIPVTGVTVIGSATPFSPQYAAANASNGIAGLGGIAGVEYASAGQGTTAYVDFDLGAATPITAFEMFDRLFVDDRTTSFNLIFSNNADMSSPVATKSYNKSSTWTASDNFAPVTARYVRYDVTGGSNNTGLGDITFFRASTVPDITVEQSFGSELTDRVTGWGLRPDTVEGYRVPSLLRDVVQVGSAWGSQAPYGLARKRNGTVTAWGNEFTGAIDPTAWNFTNVIHVAASQDHFLVLRNDGAITQQVLPGGFSYPADGPPASVPNAIEVAAASPFGMALKSDGTVTGWGIIYNPTTEWLQMSDVVAGVTNVVAIHARDYTAWVVKADGTIQGWGTINTINGLSPGHLNVPAGLTGVVGISGDHTHTLALKNDGTVVAWGRNDYGQSNVPAGLTDVIAVSAGNHYSYALKSDGTLVGWGTDYDGSLSTPAGIGHVTSIVTNASQTLALRDSTVVAFGSQGVNSTSAEKTITLRNSGFGPLNISSVSLVGPNDGDFVLNTTGMSNSIAPAGTTTFTIAFAPTAQNLRRAKIRIVSNDPVEGSKDMSLSGFGTLIAAPTVTTPTQTAITATSATLGGNVTAGGGRPITERGIVYALNSDSTLPRIGGTGVTKVVATTNGVGVFTVDVTGLTPSASYSFAPFATNSVGTSYGDVMTFDTPSNIADLSGLTISAGTLTPAFASGTTSYTVSVLHAVSSMAFTPTVAQAKANVTVNGSSAISGAPPPALPLIVGSNPISIAVTAEDGTKKTYTVTVSRADLPNTAPSFVIPTASGSVLGATWTPRLNDANRLWRGIALSADGLRIAACAAGPGSIWTSADGGVTWTERTAAGSRAWNGICSSADGTKLAAIAVTGRIWTSADSGATWTERTGVPVGDWGAITCDSTGMKLFASNHTPGGVSYTSTNQGAAWTARTLPRCLWLASSADGSRLAGFVSGGSLQVSTNGGSTWTVTPFSDPGMRDLAMSADGMRIFCAAGDQVHLSTNGGTSFARVGLNVGILSVTCSLDGTRAACLSINGNVHVSTDGGLTWVQTPVKPAGYPWVMRLAGDGSRLATITDNGPLHTSIGSVSSTQTAQEGDPQQIVPNFITNISPGTRAGEASQTVSFNLTNTNNALFSVQPAIAANGTLTYTPAVSGTGSATVSIIAQDNGGTANGGVDTSAAQTFTITITPGANLDLAALAISVGSLTPAFAPGTTSYTASVADTVTSVTLTPTLADTSLKLSVNGSALASGATSPPLPLGFGPNTLTVMTSNATGSRTKSYVVVVTRQPVAPTVTTPSFTDVVANSATLGGTITADGGSAILERGIVYSVNATNADPLIGGTGVTKVTASGTAVSAFTTSVTGLSPVTLYAFKAYATNAAGTSYSSAALVRTINLSTAEVTDVSPRASLPAGGGTVTLTGRYFTGATAVSIGGVAATGVNVVSDTSLTATIPAGSVGEKDIAITTTSGTGTASKAFRYVDLTVTTNADSGAGSLREALRGAADCAGANTITFAPTLATQTISANLVTLAGTGNDNGFVLDDLGGVTLDGNGVTLTVNAPEGRVFYVRTGALTLRGLTIAHAGGPLPGGAIYSSGILNVERCTLRNNKADFGGAIYNDNGTLTITQSTLAANSAYVGGAVGGAIASSGSVLLRHCTIAGNNAGDSGGGVFATQSITVENSMIAGNSARAGRDVSTTAAIVRNGANIISDIQTTGSLTGSGTILSVDPLLTGLAANGGPTQTMGMQTNSQAINAAVSSSITSDQRGQPVQGVADIGAFELQPTAPALGVVSVTDTTGTSAALNGVVASTGGANLSERGFVYALTSANADPQIGGAGVTKLIASGTGAGGFTATATGLSAGSGYSVRGYAINGIGTSYGAVDAFDTLSNNADLSALTISSGTLSPAFASSTTSYSSNVVNAVSNVTLTPTAASANATFKVNGSASSTVPLNVGANAISIVVTAEDGSTTKTYALTLTRAATTPSLARTTRDGLAVNGEVANDGGSAITERGIVLALTSTSNNPVIGSPGVTKLLASSTTGNSFITTLTGLTPSAAYSVRTFATNSIGSGYGDVFAVDAPSNNANLSALTISTGSLAPAFASGQLTYTASTAATTLTVAPTAENSGSTVRVDGSVVGTASTPLPLVAGINTVTILVTAGDGSTTKTYTIAVSRASGPPVLAAAATQASISGTGATLGGNITSDNGGTITERGIVYALTSANTNPEIGGTGVTKVIASGTSLGAFTTAVSGLTISSGYSFKAYATNGAGTGYSSVATFTTGNGLANVAPSFTLPASGFDPPGAVWTQLTTSPSNGQCLDVSDDGTRIVVGTSSGALHVSNNSGATWTPYTPALLGSGSIQWFPAAISNDGQRIFASASRSLSGWLVRTINGGTSFDAPLTTAQGGTWTMALSDEGMRVITISEEAGAQFSSNGGTSFAKGNAGLQPWRDIAASSNGMIAVACYSRFNNYTPGRVAITKDGGATWRELLATNGYYWEGVAISGDGQRILAGANRGGLMVSSNGGDAWESRLETDATTQWRAMTMSKDGKFMAAGPRGSTAKIWLSQDSGNTWAANAATPAGGWFFLRFTANGGKLYGMNATDGKVWVSEGSPTPHTLAVNPGSGLQSVPALATNISPGTNEPNQTVSFTVTTDNNALFRVLPSIAPNGTLTFAPGVTPGQATVTVIAQDNGGTAGGGVDTSAAQTFVIKLLGNDTAGTWNTAAWTNDASTAINTDRTVFARRFGGGSPATINGITVSAIESAAVRSADFDLTGADQIYNGDENALTALTAGSATMARDFIWRGNPYHLKLKNLIPNMDYVLSFFSVGWDGDAAGDRLLHFGSGSDALAVDQSQFGVNNGIRVSYAFRAVNDTRDITICPANTEDRSFHIYSLALNVANVATNSAPSFILVNPAQIAENNALGAVVGKLDSFDQDAGQRFRYEFVTGDGAADNALFGIDGSTLKILTGTNFEDRTSYSIRVRSTDNGFPPKSFDQRLSITVGNINEPATDIVLEKPRMVEGVSYTTLLTALDPDTENANQRYVLVPGEGAADNADFRVSFYEGNVFRVGDESTYLSFNNSTNFETKDRYQIRLRCWDAADPSVTFEKALTLLVEDVDEAHTISTIATQNILEDGTMVPQAFTITDPERRTAFTVTASSSNQRLVPDANLTVTGSGTTWSIAAKPVANANVINSNGGTTITLRVRDSVHIASTAFNLNVIAVNDAPSVTMGTKLAVNAFDESFSLTGFASGISAGPQEVYGLFGNSFPNFVLLSNDNPGLFRGGPPAIDSYGTLRFNAASKTVNGTANLVFVLRDDGGTDNGGVNQSSPMPLAITFQTNNSPSNITLTGNLSVAENTAGTIVLGSLTTTDKDAGQMHTYTLPAGQGDNASFTLTGGTTTLNLKTATAPNFEVKKSYTCVLRTTDNGVPAAFFEKSFSVSITDVNEAPTDIAAVDGKPLTLLENQGQGAEIATLKATDQDIGQTVTLSLVPGAGDNARFMLEDNVLKPVDAFDFETRSSYSVVVRAADSGTPSLTFQKTMSFTVIDANDAPTSITVPTLSFNEGVYVGAHKWYTEKEGPSVSLGSLTATDPDPGSTFTFEVLPEEDSYYFGVVGGQLAWIRRDVADFESPKKSYTVKVRATDNGLKGVGEKRGLTKTFTFNVLDVAEPTLLTDVVFLQTPGTKEVNISYSLHDPDTATVNVVIEASADNGTTWGAVPLTSLTGAVGTVKGNIRPARTEPVDDALVIAEDRRLATWNAGRDWNNQFSATMRFRVKADSGAPVVSPTEEVDTRGDGNLKITGRLVTKRTRRPWQILPNPAVARIGTRSAVADVNGYFTLNNCARGVLSISQEQAVPWELDISSQVVSRSLAMPDIALTSNTPRPVVHSIQLIGGQGPISGGIALHSFGVQDAVKAHLNWQGALGDKVIVRVNGEVFSETSDVTANGVWTAPTKIAFDQYFKPGLGIGANKVSVQIINRADQESDEEEVPVAFIPLPDNMNKGGLTQRNKQMYGPAQVGYDYGVAWPYPGFVWNIPVVGRVGFEVSFLGSFDYTFKDAQWENMFRSGDVGFFGSQFKTSKVFSRPGYSFDSVTERNKLQSPFDGRIPKLIVYFGKVNPTTKKIDGYEIELAAVSRSNGVATLDGGIQPANKEILAAGIKFGGPIAQIEPLKNLGLPSAVRKWLRVEGTLSAFGSISGSATWERQPDNSMKLTDGTIGVGGDVRATVAVGNNAVGISGFLGGDVYMRFGFTNPVFRELNLKAYGGVAYWFLFVEDEFKFTLLELKLPEGNKTADSLLASSAEAAPRAMGASVPVDLSLPPLQVVPLGNPTGPRPMRRPWLKDGSETFVLAPVAAPSTQVQARLRKSGGAAAAAAPAAAPTPELNLFNKLGVAPAKPDPRLAAIIPSDPVPAQAVLPLLENIFPKALPALAERDGKIVLLYTRDTGVSNPMHFAEIAYSYYNGTSWTTPGSVAADPRGQSMPSVQFDGLGQAVAVWIRLKDLAYTGQGGFEAQAAQMELVSSTLDPNTGVWSAPIALTNNEVIDYQPTLSGPLSDGDLMMTWVRNNGNQMSGTVAQPDEFYTARWDAATATWGPPVIIASGLAGVGRHDFAARGDKAALVWTQDADADPEIVTDTELWSMSWDGSTWSSPVQHTTDAIADDNAHVVISEGGDVFATWMHDKDLVMDRNFSGTTSIVRADSTDGGISDYTLTVGPQDRLLAMWQGTPNNQPDAFYRIYDPAANAWSADAQLSDDADLEALFVPIWDNVGNLLVAYHNKELKRETAVVQNPDGTTSTVPDLIVEGRTDLFLARRRIITDLKVKADSLKAICSTFGPGSAVTLQATLLNSGDLPVTNATVSFYDGDPSTGGTLIGTATRSGALNGMEAYEASLAWIVPSDPAVKHTLFAIADASNAVTEHDETDNRLSLPFGGPDLRLEVLSKNVLADGSARINVRVSNIGSPTSSVTDLRLWSHPMPGTTPVLTKAVPALEANDFAELPLDLPIGSILNSEPLFRLVVNEAFTLDEPNPANNESLLSLRGDLTPSSVTGLRNLALTGATLSPDFDTQITNYTASVSLDQTSITLVPTALHGGSTIRVNGTVVASSQVSEAISLNPGSTVIVVTVTSEDGTKTMIYNVTLHRSIDNTEDSGVGSLRAALAAAALRAGDDVITIPPSLNGQTLRLGSTIAITDPNGVTIDGSALKDGITIEGSGGQRLFDVAADSSLTLICVTLKNGSAAIQNNGTVRLQRCSLIDNTTALNNTSIATAFIEQSTFAENDADTINNQGTATIRFSTFATNVGPSIRNTGELTVENSIVLNDLIASSVTYLGTNIIPASSVSSFSGPAPLTADPLLSDLGRHGGPTQTFVPQAGSLAVDHAFADASTLPAVDQRGYPRPLGTHPDIGSTEGRVLIVTTAMDEFDPVGVVGAGYSVREAVRDAETDSTILFDRAVFNGATATTNTITLTNGPLNALRQCTLDGSPNPGGIRVISLLSFLTQPAAQTVQPGATAIFTASASNASGGLSYQWRRDGINLEGQIGSTFKLTNTSEIDEAIYDVIISAAASQGELTLKQVTLDQPNAQSQPASLIVGTSPLRVLRQPEGQMIPLGGSLILSVAAVGPATPALTYQWMLNGKAIAKATAMNYAITNAALTHAGAYTCVIKSGTITVTSANAEVAVVDALPKSVSLLVGGTFTPKINAAGNGLRYLWRFGTTVLASTANTFTVKPLTLADAGLYTCEVTGPSGSIRNGFNTTLNVTGSAPTLGGINLPDAYIGQSYHYQLPVVPIAGAPATSFSMTGVPPAGITFNSTTGVLSGRPTATRVGGYNLTFTAINLKNKSAPVTDNLAVIAVDPRALGIFAGVAPRSLINENLGGRFDLTTTALGTFSGSVTLGARAKISFKDLLLQVSGAGDQVLQGNITGITMADTAKTKLAAFVEVFVADQTARLTLTHPNGTQLVIPAWKQLSPATSFASKYSARLSAGSGGETSPDGYGFTTFTIAPTGSLSLAGKLPDGTVITGGSFIGQRGQVLVNQLLYANKGSLIGQLSISAEQAITGVLTWSKPVTADTNYKLGFGPLNVIAAGGAYVAPATGTRVMQLANTTANANLTFALGGLTEFITQPVTITNTGGTNNKASIDAPVQNTITMPVLNATTGAFSGSFIIPGATAPLNRLAPYFGQIVKIDGLEKGYGYFLLPKVPVGTEKVTTSPKLSGTVELIAP